MQSIRAHSRSAGLFTALLVFLSGLAIVLIPPAPVSAAGKNLTQLQQEAKVYSAYKAVVEDCFDHFEDSFDTEGDTSANNLYAEMFDGKSTLHQMALVGSHVASGGTLDCIDDGTTLFPILGYKNAIDVVYTFYAKTEDNNFSLMNIKHAALLANKARENGVELGADGDITKLSDGGRYYAIYQALKDQCGLERVGGGNAYDALPSNRKARIWEVKDGAVGSEQVGFSIAKDDEYGVDGYARSSSSGSAECIVLLRELSTNKALAEAYAAVLAADGDTGGSIADAPGALATPGADATGSDESCEAKGGEWSWALCPVLKVMGRALEWVDSALVSLLEVDRDKYTSSELYKAWAQFRNIGLTLLIAAMLVMVISTALGISMFDAYTVKKAFPRMVAAVIFILLSWWICITLIDIVNVLGRGTLGLMTSPFASEVNDLRLSTIFGSSTGGSVAQGAVVLGIGVALVAVPGALAVLLSWVGTALLIMGIAFLTLVARQMVIVVLVLFAPVAILSWIFPGNDKPWKLWWQTFSKLLLMYPMVMALIGAGRIFASVIGSTPASGAEGALLMPLLKLTAYVLPYLFIPFTFKAAGGVFGNLVGMANDRSRGAFDRLKKGRQKNMSDIGKRMGAGTGFRGNNILSRAANNTTSGVASGPKGLISKRHRMASRETKLTALGASATKNSPVYDANKNNDMFLLAAANEELAKQKILDAENKAKTAGTAQERAEAKQEAEARKRALAMARSMPVRDRSTQRQAALDLAATGYQFSAGEKGHRELSQISRAINGNDDAAHANFMNSAQYNLKGAGRYDLGGLNNGGAYDRDTGVNKAGLSELAHGKKEAIQAMTEDIPEVGPLTDAQAARVLTTHQELQSMLPYATGGNRDEIIKQMDKLNTTGALSQAQTIGNTRNYTTADGQQIMKTVTDPNTGVQSQIPITLAEGAARSARSYQPPNPGTP